MVGLCARVRSAVQELGLTEERNTKIAPNGQCLSVRTKLHDSIVDGAVARIENGPVAIVEAVSEKSR